MGAINRADALSRPSASVRHGRTMAYRGPEMTPLQDHQYRHSWRHHEYRSRCRDLRAGYLLPSAGGGRAPLRSGRRRTQRAAESVPRDPGACPPPFLRPVRRYCPTWHCGPPRCPAVRHPPSMRPLGCMLHAGSGPGRAGPDAHSAGRGAGSDGSWCRANGRPRGAGVRRRARHGARCP